MHQRSEIIRYESECSAFHALGSDARPASHALLHPTGKPEESNGPFKGAGPINFFEHRIPNFKVSNLQFGPRSTGQSRM